MKVNLKEEDLLSTQLSWLCVKPMLLAVRGKDLQTKLEMYQQLNEGQKGIYLFYSFHNHVNSIEEFYWFSGYYIIEIQSWHGIKSGVQYFKDIEMVELLDQIEGLIEKCKKEDGVWQASPSDLERDTDLLQEVKELYEKYKRISGNTISQMNTYIVHNKEEFIEEE
ncbi:hypothetical protein [Paenibacillus segetis]|uniref:DUF4375 domain-containing protein n=1 Tax=Paenibacillus segetis TaxID=1325360 RepID=A0ABQ1YIB2_9BACL|nr:hypothetical protein [Paenibacillus segetis]GGH27328.1 hypothetical protein GCM10008013_28700 [Paenibacillus segetis]